LAHDCPGTKATPSLPLAATLQVGPGVAEYRQEQGPSDSASRRGSRWATTRLRESASASVSPPDSYGRKTRPAQRLPSSSDDMDGAPGQQICRSQPPACASLLEDGAHMSADRPSKRCVYRRRGSAVEINARAAPCDDLKAGADEDNLDKRARSPPIGPIEDATAARRALEQSMKQVTGRPPQGMDTFVLDDSLASPIRVMGSLDRSGSAREQFPPHTIEAEAELIGTEMAANPRSVASSPNGNAGLLTHPDSAARAVTQPHDHERDDTQLLLARAVGADAPSLIPLDGRVDEKTSAKSIAPSSPARTRETGEHFTTTPTESTQPWSAAPSAFPGGLETSPLFKQKYPIAESRIHRLTAILCPSPPKSASNRMDPYAKDVSEVVEHALALAGSEPVQALSKLLHHAHTGSVKAMVSAAELLGGGKNGWREDLGETRLRHSAGLIML
jgi:hypothetical protein